MKQKIWAIQARANKNKNSQTNVAKICIMLIIGVGLLESDLVWGAQFRGFYQLKTHEG